MVSNEDVQGFRNYLSDIMRKKNEIAEMNSSISIRKNHLGNKYIIMDGVKIAIDSWIPEVDLIYISHAHMDHIPVIPKDIREKLHQGQLKVQFLCSKITKDIAASRTNGKLKFPEDNWLLGHELEKKVSVEFKGITLSLLLNGHTYGSTSLLIEGTETIFYTSDFITEDRLFSEPKTSLKGIKPIKCDKLITECTFGAQKYVFPSFHEIQKELNHYVQKQIDKGHPVILLGYAFGKSQVLLNTLELANKIILQRDIAKNTEILEKNRIKFSPWEPYGNYNKKQLKKMHDYVLITPPYFMFLEPCKSLISAGAKVIAPSGKVLHRSYRKEFGADKYMPFSDHCDFKSLAEFVKGCHARTLFINHGRIEEFAYSLLKSQGNTDILSLEYTR